MQYIIQLSLKASRDSSAILKTQKYVIEKLSARQIADVIGCGHATINNAFSYYRILKEPRKRGWVEYGHKLHEGKRVPHIRQQIIIRSIRAKRASGWSNRRIAEWLNSKGVKSPSGYAVWYGATVGRFLRAKKD